MTLFERWELCTISKEQTDHPIFTVKLTLGPGMVLDTRLGMDLNESFLARLRY